MITDPSQIPHSGLRLYPRLLRYVRPYWRTFGLSIAAMGLLGATEPALPALLKPLLDGSFIEQDARARLFVPALLIAVFLLRGALSYAGDVSVNWVAQKVIKDLRDAIFRKLVTLPATFYDHRSSGDLMSRLSFDVAQVAEAATRTLTALVRDTLAATGLVAYMLYLNWRLSLAVLLVTPAVALILTRAARRLRTRSRQVQQAMAAITSVAQEAIDCHKAVKVNAAQAYELARFQRATNTVRQLNMKVVVASAASAPLVQAIVATALSVLTYVAASESASGGMTVGDFISLITAMTLLLQPIRHLSSVNENLQRGLAAAESAFDLIDEESEADDGATVIARARGEIVFRNVSLSYTPSVAPALRNVSLRIGAGETVALVGASGSGKTSLVNLIPRFYDPTGGQILIDGFDITTITRESLRRNIAIVSQEVLLFNDTVRHNIAYGALHGCSETEIQRAAQAAYVLEFVALLPEGLDTVIGEDGVRLSGGQRQRIAIARAILKDAPILLLDEATSALDTASERHIQAALESLRQGRTCVVIAHRLSTVENADRIIVLQHGEVVEIDTHRELLRRRGVYANLHRIRAAETSEPRAARSAGT